MSKKEPTIAKAKIISNKCFGNDEGDIVNIKEIDKYGNIYYYDTFHRWCYLKPGEYEIIKEARE